MKRITKILRETGKILFFLCVCFAINYTIFSLTGEEGNIIRSSIIPPVVTFAIFSLYYRFKRPK